MENINLEQVKDSTNEAKSAEQLEVENMELKSLVPQKTIELMRGLCEKLDLKMDDDRIRLVTYAYLTMEIKAVEAKRILATPVSGEEKDRLNIRAIRAIRTPFERVDDLLFTVFGDDKELLNTARMTLGGPVNELMGGLLKAEWPEHEALLREELHNPINPGGRVDWSETAILRDSKGKILSRSRVQTF